MKDAGARMFVSAGAAIVRESEKADELKLEEIYDSYAHSLLRYALALTRCSEDAEDVVQEVFVKIARDKKRLADVEGIKPYLYTSVRNAAYSLLRSRRRRDQLHDEICAEFRVEIAAEAGGGEIDPRVVCEAFAELPVEQREVLVLKVYDQMTFKEIAEATRSSINTVASRYRYAIARLRQALGVDDNE